MRLSRPLSILTANRFGQDVLWNMGSMVVLAVGGILMNSLILALRGEAALGIFNQVFAIYIVLSQVGVGGVQYSALTQIAYVQTDRDRAADIALAALALVLALSVTIVTLLAFVSPFVGAVLQSEAVAAGLQLALPGLIFFGLNKVLINILNGLQYMRIYAVFRALRYILLPGFAVGIIFTGAPDANIALALTLAELVLFAMLVVYIYGWILPRRWPHTFWQDVRMHINFGVRGILTGVLSEMITRVDVLMLGLVSSDAVVGLYSFAAILAEGFSQLAVAVRNNVDPRLGQYFTHDERSAITDFARQIRRYFVPVMFGIGLLAAAAYPVLYYLLSGQEGLTTSWLVFIILAAGHVLTAAYTPFNGILLIGNLPGWQTGLMFFTTVTSIALNTLLIPLLGIHGAALATALTYILSTGALILLAKTRLNVQL